MLARENEQKKNTKKNLVEEKLFLVIFVFFSLVRFVRARTWTSCCLHVLFEEKIFIIQIEKMFHEN